jgi:predicted small lipoprotein YifL
MNRARLCVLVVLTASVLGCGQKGPLVLPDAQHTHKKVKFPSLKTPAPPAAPAQAPSAPAGPVPNNAPPEAAPGSNSTPNPAPQG